GAGPADRPGSCRRSDRQGTALDVVALGSLVVIGGDTIVDPPMGIELMPGLRDRRQDFGMALGRKPARRHVGFQPMAIEHLEQPPDAGLPAIVGIGQRKVVDLAASDSRGSSELAVALKSLKRQPDRQGELLTVRPAPAPRIAYRLHHGMSPFV